MILKTKPTYYTKFRDDAFNQFVLEVYDDLRMLEPTIVDDLPTPVKEYRGKFIVKRGDPDEVYVCIYSGGSYQWKRLSLV